MTAPASSAFPLSCKRSRTYGKTVISDFFLYYRCFLVWIIRVHLLSFSKPALRIAYINSCKTVFTQYWTNILTIPNSFIIHSMKHWNKESLKSDVIKMLMAFDWVKFTYRNITQSSDMYFYGTDIELHEAGEWCSHVRSEHFKAQRKLYVSSAFTLNKSAFCPQSVFVCSVRFSQ
jgi:hypothetical protein